MKRFPGDDIDDLPPEYPTEDDEVDERSAHET
jgi:hypothetical protein